MSSNKYLNIFVGIFKAIILAKKKMDRYNKAFLINVNLNINVLLL